MIKRHKIEIMVRKLNKNSTWEIRIKGVTSGFQVHNGYDDNSIVFQLDSSRFEPVFERV